jgi:hypothetical protein
LGGALVILNVCWAPLAAGLGLLVGVAGLPTLGATLSAVAGGLATLAAIVTGPVAAAIAAAAILKPSATNAGEEKTPGFGNRFEDKDPNIGKPGVGGASPYAALPPRPLTENHGPVRVIVENGRDIAHGVGNYMADQMSRPQSGQTGPDMRLSPVMPGMGLSY